MTLSLFHVEMQMIVMGVVGVRAEDRIEHAAGRIVRLVQECGHSLLGLFLFHGFGRFRLLGSLFLFVALFCKVVRTKL